MNRMRLLNIAGKQRMLTQQMIKLILVKRFDVYKNREIANKVNVQITHVKDEFESALNLLKKDKNNSCEIETQLDLVSQKWTVFIHSIENAAIETVIEKNGDVLIEMDKAVSLYETSDSKNSSSRLWKPLL